MKNKDSVPGLSRGLQTLKLLGETEKASLNELQKATSIPKSSLLRVLETLVEQGYAERCDNGKNYKAIARIVPLTDVDDSWHGRLVNALSSIAEKTGQTAEWFSPVEGGLMLTQRREPPGGEVRVRAQIGFFRKICDGCELEAAVKVALAFSERDVPKNMWTYEPDGVKFSVKADDAKDIINETRKTACAMDIRYNSFGVKRMACAVMKDKKLLGVLALAQCYIPSPDKNIDSERLKILAGKAQELHA
jgi:IclR family mhp operon transcriptional activator